MLWPAAAVSRPERRLRWVGGIPGSRLDGFRGADPRCAAISANQVTVWAALRRLGTRAVGPYQALIDASVQLANAAANTASNSQNPLISKAKAPGMAAALMMPNGQITAHTSMRADTRTHPKNSNLPADHGQVKADNMLDNALKRVAARAAAFNGETGANHGRCAEIALIGDALANMRQQWNPATDGPFLQYARAQFDGARIVSAQIGNGVDNNGNTYQQGDYRPCCPTCAEIVKTFNIQVVPPPAATPTPPGQSGAVGNGQPLDATRPQGPSGLEPVDPSDQQAVENAVRGPDGNPTVHPDPSTWVDTSNDGGRTVPGRSTNCADVSLAVASTWHGNPQVGAAVTNPATGETGSTARQEAFLGAQFQPEGNGVGGLNSVAQQLLASGPGSSAVIITSWTAAAGGGAHSWNVVNNNGVITWIDGQSGIVCTVAHERPHNGRAEEHFLPAGPFAILPLKDEVSPNGFVQHRSSIVWSERSENVPALLESHPEDLLVELERRFGLQLGRLAFETKPQGATSLGGRGRADRCATMASATVRTANGGSPVRSS